MCRIGLRNSFCAAEMAAAAHVPGPRASREEDEGNIFVHPCLRLDRQYEKCQHLQICSEPNRWRVTAPPADETRGCVVMHEINGHLRYYCSSPSGQPSWMIVKLKSGVPLQWDHTAEVEDSTGTKMGTIHKSHMLDHHLRVSMQHVPDVLTMAPPSSADWLRLEFHWKGHHGQHPAAILHKKWGEGDRREITDADQYDVEFLGIDLKWRPLIFAAALVIDWLYFHSL